MKIINKLREKLWWLSYVDITPKIEKCDKGIPSDEAIEKFLKQPEIRKTTTKLN